MRFCANSASFWHRESRKIFPRAGARPGDKPHFNQAKSYPDIIVITRRPDHDKLQGLVRCTHLNLLLLLTVLGRACLRDQRNSNETNELLSLTIHRYGTAIRPRVPTKGTFVNPENSSLPGSTSPLERADVSYISLILSIGRAISPLKENVLV